MNGGNILMNTRIFAISLVMLVFVSLVIGCSSQTTSPVNDSNASKDVNTGSQTSEQASVGDNNTAALDGKTLVEARCTVCHGLGKVESASMNQEQWKKVVENMVSKGAELSAEEQTVVIEYLATTYP